MEYAEIFAQRGNRYHEAMLMCPHARDAEFQRLFDVSPAADGARVLDMPAGGGYLARHLPAWHELVSLELAAGFGGGVPVHDVSGAWEHGDFDHIVSLAALHHVEDQAGFIAELLAHLRPRGTLHLADASRDSRIPRFLDGFVGGYNVTGHQGKYLPADREWFARLGRIGRIGEIACPWWFEDEAQMLAFCERLFGLVECPPAALHDALAEYVGVRREHDRVLLDWRLLYVDLQAA